MRGAVQMEGPSPLLPAWLDFWLQPARAAWSRGLKSGASPLLLPDAHPSALQAHKGIHSHHSGSDQLQVQLCPLPTPGGP
jgi:hypothetical protein